MNSQEIKEAISKLNEKIHGMSDDEIRDMIEKMDATDPLCQALLYLFM